MKGVKELQHYQEANGFKIGDIVYRLNHYTVEEAYIQDIFDDYYSDDENYICKWVKTNKGYDHLSDIYTNRVYAERKIQEKKETYDRYVTRGY
jgi:hypothetical protein